MHDDDDDDDLFVYPSPSVIHLSSTHPPISRSSIIHADITTFPNKFLSMLQYLLLGSRLGIAPQLCSLPPRCHAALQHYERRRPAGAESAEDNPWRR